MRIALTKKTKDAEIFVEIKKIFDAELRKWSREYGPRSERFCHRISLFNAEIIHATNGYYH